MTNINWKKNSGISVLSQWDIFSKKESYEEMKKHLDYLTSIRKKDKVSFNKYINSTSFRKDWSIFCYLHDLQYFDGECSIANIDTAIWILNWYEELSKESLDMIKAIKRANKRVLDMDSDIDKSHLELSKDFLDLVIIWNQSTVLKIIDNEANLWLIGYKAKNWDDIFNHDLVYNSIISWSVDIWEVKEELLISLLEDSDTKSRNKLIKIYEKIDSKPKNLSFRLLEKMVEMWYMNNIVKFFDYYSREFIHKIWLTVLEYWNEKSLETLFTIYSDLSVCCEEYHDFSKILIKKGYIDKVLDSLEKTDRSDFHLMDIIDKFNELFYDILKYWTEEDEERIIDIFIKKDIISDFIDWYRVWYTFIIDFVKSIINLWKEEYLILKINWDKLENIDYNSLKTILECNNEKLNKHLFEIYKWLDWWNKNVKLRKHWKAFEQYFNTHKVIDTL